MRRRDPARTRALVVGAALATALAVAMVLVAVRFASRNPEQANLGTRTLRFSAARLSKEIARDGPFLLKDPLRTRDVYVQHLGPGRDDGWLAISAYAGRPDPGCLLRWQGDGFSDPCTGVRYPPDGAGLRTWPAQVERGSVLVELRR